MIILHGKYKKGKIEIDEKDLPEIESTVEIRLLNDKIAHNKKSLSEVVGQYDFGGIFDGVNVRDMIYD